MTSLGPQLGSAASMTWTTSGSPNLMIPTAFTRARPPRFADSSYQLTSLGLPIFERTQLVQTNPPETLVYTRIAGPSTTEASLLRQGRGKRGGQHRPDPEQLDQGRVGLGNRGLDARLHRGDPLLQLAHVGHEVDGKLPADDRRRLGRGHLTEQGGGPLGAKVASGTTGDQVHQQAAQAADGVGVRRR